MSVALSVYSLQLLSEPWHDTAIHVVFAFAAEQDSAFYYNHVCMNP